MVILDHLGLDPMQIMSNTSWWAPRWNVAKMVVMLESRSQQPDWYWLYLVFSYHLIREGQKVDLPLLPQISSLETDFAQRPESKSGWTCLQHASCSMLGTVAPSSETKEKSKISLQSKEPKERLAFSSPTQIASWMRTPKAENSTHWCWAKHMARQEFPGMSFHKTSGPFSKRKATLQHGWENVQSRHHQEKHQISTTSFHAGHPKSTCPTSTIPRPYRPGPPQRNAGWRRAPRCWRPPSGNLLQRCARAPGLGAMRGLEGPKMDGATLTLHIYIYIYISL